MGFCSVHPNLIKYIIYYYSLLSFYRQSQSTHWYK